MAGEAHGAAERPARAPVHLSVNGERIATAAANLAELLDQLGYGGRKVATAVNGDFVAERARDITRLSADDAVEVVSPRQGG